MATSSSMGAMLFKCFDTARDGRTRYTAHTGFANPHAPAETRFDAASHERITGLGDRAAVDRPPWRLRSSGTEADMIPGRLQGAVSPGRYACRLGKAGRLKAVRLSFWPVIRATCYRQKLARITLDSMVQFVGLLDAKGTVLEINRARCRRRQVGRGRRAAVLDHLLVAGLGRDHG